MPGAVVSTTAWKAAEDEATATLLANLDGEKMADPRTIRFTTGRRRKCWVRNVVAIGLSSGFIEPLESTSIHLFQVGAMRLMQLFPWNGCSPVLINRYNEQSQIEYEKIRDFIILHYKLNERDDSAFWRDCREMPIPATLTERIELFRDSAMAYQGADEMFRVESWVQVMIGQRVRPRSYHHMGRLMEMSRLRTAMETLRDSIGRAVAGMPTHREFLESYCPTGGG